MCYVLLIAITLLVHAATYMTETDGSIACRLAQEYLPKNPIILEAGAHYGEDTTRMKKQWPHSTIHAFEPHPQNYSKLKHATQYIDGVFCYPLALSDSIGTAQFYCSIHDGASSLLECADWHTEVYRDRPPIIVQCITLDEWARKYNIETIDFCWLDMEGAELKMLQHATILLSKIKAIYIEVNFKEYRKGMVQYAEIKKFLTSHGFQQIFITPGTTYEVQANALFVRTDMLQQINGE